MEMQTHHGEITHKIIAVIDDDEISRELLSEELEQWGYSPEPFEGDYPSIKDLTKELESRKPDVVVCDNQLQAGGYAGFFGAAAAAYIHQTYQIPSILVTKYQDSDELRLKKWRPDIPVILDKDDVNEETLASSISKCEQEIMKGNPFSDRRAHRSLVVVEDIKNEIVVAFIPSWNTDVAVNFPIDLIPANLRDQCSPGSYWLAHINIGALERRDLYFKDFQLAAEPRDDDGLT